MNRNVLVDADGLLYLAGAVGETREYSAVFEDADGNLHQDMFDSAQAVKDFLAENEGFILNDRELVTTPGPLEYCLQVAKGKMKEIVKRYPGNLEVYLKAPGEDTNWRYDIATLAPYKGNRTAPKPFWLEEIRNYLLDTWEGVGISGKEADDHIATRAFESSKPCVIVSPDKDLDQIPGLHWNYAKNVEYEIFPYEASFFFWQQVLSGDTADNIKGCWKIGAKKATELVEQWLSEEALSPEEIWIRVVGVYEDSMGLKSCPYAGMPADLVALENARLVWMQTEAGRLWTPPGLPYEYLEATLDD